MATNTYVALDKITVSGTSTTSVTLSGISGAYTDLRLVINSQNQNSTNQPYIQFNADTSTGSTNYSTTSVRGDGSSAASGRHTNQNGWYPVPGPGVGTTGNFQPWLVDIMNYSNTTTYKTGISRFNNASSIVSANVHLWRSTAAITSITITAESGAGYIASGSTFSLYGIAAEGAPFKATGGIITSDATYYYHTFRSTGTFTPLQSLTADILVVAGGGGGGSDAGGGGGAGGLAYYAAQSLTATGYTCTVGAGGATATAATIGNSGSNSQFTGLTAAVGGGAGSTTVSPAGTGGSGGGGGRNNGQAGGSATSGQGFAGGNGVVNTSGGGGGGASAVGSNGSGATAGNGGAGSNTYSVWSSATSTGVSGYYSGGGGGGASVGGTIGTGGAGGGGNGGINNPGNGVAGIANTGGGGGGGGGSYGVSTNGAAGGSGIVIVRYAKV